MGKTQLRFTVNHFTEDALIKYLCSVVMASDEMSVHLILLYSLQGGAVFEQVKGYTLPAGKTWFWELCWSHSFKLLGNRCHEWNRKRCTNWNSNQWVQISVILHTRTKLLFNWNGDKFIFSHRPKWKFCSLKSPWKITPKNNNVLYKLY